MDNDTIDNNCHYFLHFFDVTQKFRLKFMTYLSFSNLLSKITALSAFSPLKIPFKSARPIINNDSVIHIKANSDVVHKNVIFLSLFNDIIVRI